MCHAPEWGVVFIFVWVRFLMLLVCCFGVQFSIRWDRMSDASSSSSSWASVVCVACLVAVVVAIVGAPATLLSVSETQLHFPQQEQAHLIPSGTSLGRIHLNTCFCMMRTSRQTGNRPRPMHSGLQGKSRVIFVTVKHSLRISCHKDTDSSGQLLHQPQTACARTHTRPPRLCTPKNLFDINEHDLDGRSTINSRRMASGPQISVGEGELDDGRKGKGRGTKLRRGFVRDIRASRRWPRKRRKVLRYQSCRNVNRPCGCVYRNVTNLKSYTDPNPQNLESFFL